MTKTNPASRPQNAPVSPADVRRLADEGLGRNAIARRLGATRHAVDTAAKAAGVTFDRAATRAAVAAWQADATLEREELAADFRRVTRVVLNRILNASDLDPGDLRDLLWSAGSSAASDARLGRLALDVARNPGTAAEGQPWDEVTAGIRDALGILDGLDVDDLDPHGQFD